MIYRSKRILLKTLFVLVAVSLTLTGFAQKPDYSGTWKLNTSKSKLGAEFSMAPGTMIISLEGNTWVAESIADFQGQEFRQKNTYQLDGSESKNEGWQGMELISIANWTGDGNTVQIKTTVEMMDGGELTITQTIGMEEGSMVIENDLQGGPMGGGDPERWVYDRQ